MTETDMIDIMSEIISINILGFVEIMMKLYHVIVCKRICFELCSPANSSTNTDDYNWNCYESGTRMKYQSSKEITSFNSTQDIFDHYEDG